MDRDVSGVRPATAALPGKGIAFGAVCAVAVSMLLDSCSGAIKTAVAPVAEPAGAGSPAHVRLMTGQQYLNTIAYIFGSDISIISPFAPLPRTDGLVALGSTTAGVPSGEMQQFQRTATAIAEQVVDAGNLDLGVPGHRNFLVPCKPASDHARDDACASKFLSSIGRKLYRHPLSQEKTAQLVAEAGKATGQLNDFYLGLARTLEGMLISPEFLFIADNAEPDSAHPGRQHLDAYSYAARLAFFLWNAAPDDNVLKAAETGELMTPKGRAKVVDMMLASPRLEQGVRAFFDDMFAFDDFDNLAKDAAAYPTVTGVTLADAREQTLRTIVDQLIVKKNDYRDLYTSRDMFMSPSLAAVYRVPTTPGWRMVEFPADSPRAGILTHVSFLAVHAHPARSSATKRGKALRELLLCQTVPPPPPNVDFSVVEDPKATFHTARERLTAHRKNPVCAGCHRITDPMGLALENFDGAGQYRDSERGTVIDASGTLDGKDFKDAAGLGQALHDHGALSPCLVKRVYSYATGVAPSDKDEALLKYFSDRFAAAGYRLQDLLRTIVLSEAFSEISEEAAPVKTAAAK